MSDDGLRDLLQSPLEAERERRGRPAPGRRRRLWVGLGAAVVGGVLTWLGWLAFGGDDEPVAAGTTTTTVATTTTTTLVTGIPDTLTPVSDDVLVWADAVLIRDGRAYVSVALVTAPGVERTEAEQPETARWLLGDVEHTTEYVDLTAPGHVTVEFPTTELAGELTMTLGTGTLIEHFGATDIEAMPYEGELLAPALPVTDEIEVVVDAVHVNDVTGAIAWHLVGGTTERVRVSVFIELFDGDEHLGTVLTSHSLGFFGFLRAGAAPPGPTRAGQAELRSRIEDRIDAERVNRAEIRWQIEVFTYGGEPVTVSLEEATVVVVDV